MTAATDLDEALNALAEVSVALTSLYPILSTFDDSFRTGPDTRSFVEDGIEAASRARRHLIALRAELPVGVEPWRE